MLDDKNISLIAIGDVCVQREDPELTFAKVSHIFSEADILFCNLESPLTDRGERQEVLGRYLHRSDSRMLSALTSSGFNVVSLASNIMMSYGPQALFDTIEILDENNIAHTGAGRSLEEAKKPAILEVKGTRIAFLAYAAFERNLVNQQYIIATDPTRARKARAGVNPLGYSPLYEPPHVDPDDMESLKKDIGRTKKLADLLVVSFHCHGVMHYTPSMYLGAFAHSAIDEGADMILAHGPHILHGMEVYKGKVICYSLGQLVFDRPACPLPYEITHAEESVILKCMISGEEIKRVSFLPALVGGLGVAPIKQPVVLKAGDEEGERILRLMDKISKRFGTVLSFEKGEAIVLEVD